MRYFFRDSLAFSKPCESIAFGIPTKLQHSFSRMDLNHHLLNQNQTCCHCTTGKNWGRGRIRTGIRQFCRLPPYLSATRPGWEHISLNQRTASPEFNEPLISNNWSLTSWKHPDSNREPIPYKGTALTIELRFQIRSKTKSPLRLPKRTFQVSQSKKLTQYSAIPLRYTGKRYKALYEFVHHHFVQIKTQDFRLRTFDFWLFSVG